MKLYFDMEATLAEGGDTVGFFADYAGHPFHIACASLRRDRGHAASTSLRKDRGHRAIIGEQVPGRAWDEANYVGHHLTQTEARELLHQLTSQQQAGVKIFTHNGTGFDFLLLGLEAGRLAEAAQLALDSYDLCFQLLCMLGYPVGLEAISLGMGLGSKENGGELIPGLWEAGKVEEVLVHLLDDTRLLRSIIEEVEKTKVIKWYTRSGNFRAVHVPKLLTVQECLKLPPVDNSWMDKPWKREDFIEWIETNLLSE